MSDGWGRLRKALTARAGTPVEPQAIEGVASVHGLTFVGAVAPDDRPVPSLVLTEVRHEVMRSETGPRLEFGNHGTMTWRVADDTHKPQRRGYVCWEHGADLPHVYVAANGYGALSARHVLGLGARVAATMWDLVPVDGGQKDSWRPADHPVRAFCKHATIDPVGDRGFRAHLEPTSSASLGDLMTPEAVRLLGWLARSFDVEVRPGVALLYCNHGDVVTADAQVWDWVFSATSRLIDLVGLWGGGAAAPADWEHYTSDTVERPHR